MAENVLRRLRGWLRRAKTAPGLVHEVADVQHDQMLDVHAVGAEVAALSERVAMLETALLGEFERIRDVSAEQSELTLMATLGLAREAGMEQLIDAAGEPSRLRPGLSILTISWNHAGFLGASVRSALRTLDLLPPDEQGAVIVLDDCSSDETAQVLEELRAEDGRVRPVRSPVNLGLARARNVLLHIAETTHALMLDADNTALPEGATAVYRIAREWNAAFAYGNVIMVAPDGSMIATASNEPPTTDYFFAGGPHIDTLGVLDVAYFRQIGGYSPDPTFHAFDDHEIIHRLARLGALIAFVPTVAGRYRFDRLSHSQTHQGSHETAIARLRRAYNQDGRLTAQPPSAIAAHPATGPLWATPMAIAARPELETVLAPPVEAAQ
jgi:teichuronic acid biosynthesis glycosyltransferase TuaG